MLKYLDLKYTCPHCDSELTPCHAPPIHVGDGLGWGSEVLFICLNDECSLFVNGWKHVENSYQHVGSYRHMRLPDSDESYNMMVAGKDAFTGSIIDREEIEAKNKRFKREKEAVGQLDDCVAKGDLQPALYLLLDEHTDLKHRKRACELLAKLNDPVCVEPLRNHAFRDPNLEHDVNQALIKILANNFLKECPACAELIKARAKVCKHCKTEIQA